ncbi:hypothetical protein Gasu2_32940 [Galdieria sulphuraria]|uniref:HIT zinc finger family protein n=1 Tax=Galdieria sulphuraria TaxID=130081 RepID=M2X2L4_GALSU|nr:HIT zinc finger family protein [Galdieria sulphuraria]EME30625.1 HIT zinc finger family protein [Galdieria sulphuraria]GJD09022.1 hypothetical protein Gasu2_32940 [Galdieria sulphuraria]|eukprot:XP_005707145.1 HIT zinc finger family protein [Galdieria sulphuraria]
MNQLESADIGTRTRRICGVCSKKEAPYRCPKCHMAYCSKDCYESHNISCLEQFSSSFTESLRNVFASESEKTQMKQLLQRHWDEYSEDNALSVEDETEILEEALHRLDVDEPEAVFSSLPERFQQKFQRLLANGEIEDLVQVWKPWWEEEEPTIVEISKNNSDTVGHRKVKFEDCNQEKPHFKQEPSVTLNLHVVEICYAYCYCMRLFNGDLHIDCLDSFQCLLSISKVLSEDRRYSSISEVLYSVLRHSQEDIHYSNSKDFSILLIRDTRIVVGKGCKWILRAIEEAQELAKAARQELKKNNYNRDWFQTTLKVEKKLGYFKFFVESRWDETWTKYFCQNLELFEQQQLENLKESFQFSKNRKK